MPTALKTLRIADGATSTIWDYRRETRPNGGTIALRACVWHIPVIHDIAGRDDLDLLRRVLLDQGLMVHFGNDREGNIALYAKPNRLCFHARGANQVSCGVEQMHFGINDPWLRKQLRASGWIANYLEREFGIPLRMADLEPGGAGIAKVVRTGHTSHEMVSNMAGFNDRSDPGHGFDYDYVFHCARFFAEHGHFVGA